MYKYKKYCERMFSCVYVLAMYVFPWQQMEMK